MAKATRKKTFGDSVNIAFEQATLEPANLGGEIGELLATIPQAGVAAGDDMIVQFLDSVSDLTVIETPLAELVQPDAPKKQEVNPDQLGDPTAVSADFVKKLESVRKSGKTMNEAQQIVKGQTLMQATSPDEQSGFIGTGVFEEHYGTPSGAMPPVQAIEPPPPLPLTSQDLQGNAIAAEEIIEWYDVLQSVGSVWAYDFFSQPKNAVKLVEELSEKVIAGRANDSEKAAFSNAQKAVTGYASRKASFAEGVAMSQNLKDRSVRLLDKILEVRGIRIPPEALLALLLITPLVINAGKILVERFGFKDADKVLDKFTTFVTKAEREYHTDNP